MYVCMYSTYLANRIASMIPLWYSCSSTLRSWNRTPAWEIFEAEKLHCVSTSIGTGKKSDICMYVS